MLGSYLGARRCVLFPGSACSAKMVREAVILFLFPGSCFACGQPPLTLRSYVKKWKRSTPANRPLLTQVPQGLSDRSSAQVLSISTLTSLGCWYDGRFAATHSCSLQSPHQSATFQLEALSQAKRGYPEIITFSFGHCWRHCIRPQVMTEDQLGARAAPPNSTELACKKPHKGHEVFSRHFRRPMWAAYKTMWKKNFTDFIQPSVLGITLNMSSKWVPGKISESWHIKKKNSFPWMQVWNLQSTSLPPITRITCILSAMTVKSACPTLLHR